MENSHDSIFLLSNDGSLENIPRKNYENEKLLQELIEKFPELLAGSQINPVDPVRWLLVSREIGIPIEEEGSNAYSLDHLLIDQNAIPTLVEVKRSTDTRIRREVVGQMLDYAANASKYWSINKIQNIASDNYGGINNLNSKVIDLLMLDSNEDNFEFIEEFWKKVDDNLHNGHLRLLFVADIIPKELKRIIEFLNIQMVKTEVLGLELQQYIGKEFKALVPKVIGQSYLSSKSESKIKTKSNSISFIADASEKISTFFSNLFIEAEKRKIIIYWGVKGFSFRILNKNNKPVTFFYAFPPGTRGSDKYHIQGFFQGIEDATTMKIEQDKFFAIKNVTQTGDLTLNLNIDDTNLDDAYDFISKVWSLSELIKTT